MIPDRIQTGNRYIINSGVVILDGTDSELSIPIAVDDHPLTQIRILFQNDNDNTETRTAYQAEGDELVVKCINHNDKYGAFLPEAVAVGELDGKKLYLNILSTVFGSEKMIRRVEFTVYLEK